MKRVFLFFVLIVIFVFSVTATNTDIEQMDKLSLKELMNIRISTASKFDENIKDVPASIVVITRKEIKKYGYKSLSDILSNIPGFYMINDYYWLGSENFGIRGFFSAGVLNDIVILINGVNRVGGTYSDYSLAKNDIPVEAIDRIEVIRGPMSIMYGSGAFMGAINIITNTSNKNLFSVSAGSNKYKKIFLRLSKKNDEFGYTLNISKYGDDGIKGQFTKFTNNKEFLKNIGLSENALYDGMLKFTKRSIGFSAFYKDLSIDFNYFATKKGVFDGIPSYYPGTFFFDESFSLRLKYEKKINKKLFLTGELTLFSDSFYWEYNIFNGNTYATNNNKDISNEMEVNLLYDLGEYSNITLGFIRHSINYFYRTYDYPLYHTLYTNTEMTSPDNIVSDAFYSQINYGFSNKLKLIAGFRVEKLYKYRVKIKSAMFTPLEAVKEGEYTNDNYKLIPRLAAIYSPADFHTIKIIYGKAIKHPSLMQNIAQMNAGLPVLNPAFIETFELNYIFSPTPTFFTNLSIYKNNLEALIVKRNIYNPDSKTWELNSTNSGNMSTKGIELCFKIIPTNGLNLNFNLSYQNTENLEKGFEKIIPGYAPKLLGYFKADYTIDKISFALTGRYIGRMETLWDNTKISQNSEDVKGRIGDTINPQYNIDLNIGTDNVFNKGIFINLHIYNLFDRAIQFPVTTGNSWAELGTLDYRRSFIISVGRSF